MIGTLQAGYTDFPYLGPVTERIVRREALLGVSITGIMDHPEILLDAALQREMAHRVKAANAAMRAGSAFSRLPAPPVSNQRVRLRVCWERLRASIRTTQRRYLRRVQANKSETPLQFFRSINPRAVERSVWSTARIDRCSPFASRRRPQPKRSRTFRQLNFCRSCATTQQHWVLPGTRCEQCTQPWLTHNVSNTVVVERHEWEAVGDFIYDNRHFFTGVSLLPASGDKDYPQAPMARVLLPDEIVTEYGTAALDVAKLLAAVREAFDGDAWLACDSLLDHGPKAAARPLAETGRRTAWIAAAQRLADGKFGGDVRRFGHCLKDWHQYRQWAELEGNLREVDYSLMIESEDQIQFFREAACASGACLV